MECPSCHNRIQPGLTITVQAPPPQTLHCPYCLDPLPPAREVFTTPSAESLAVARSAGRRDARAGLLVALGEQAAGRAPACPSCGRALDDKDQAVLRNCEQFSCACGCDLACLAYEREAYSESRWLPLIDLLTDLRSAEQCCGCHRLGAAAAACQRAAVKNPGGLGGYDELLAALLVPRQEPPEAECPGDCPLIDQYPRLAGAGLALL